MHQNQLALAILKKVDAESPRPPRNFKLISKFSYLSVSYDYGFNKYRYQKMFVFQVLKKLNVTKGLTKFVLLPYVIMLNILQVHD